MRLNVLIFNIWYGGDQTGRCRHRRSAGTRWQDPGECRVFPGYFHADPRRHILSKYPLLDSGSGETTHAEAPAYSIAGPDPDAVQDRVPVAPGKIVAVANTHLTSDLYGPEMLSDGASLADVLINETKTDYLQSDSD